MDQKHRIAVVPHFVHRHFIWLPVASYLVAAILPSLGLTLRKVSFGEIAFLHERTEILLPMLRPVFLLLNAGFGVKETELRSLFKTPRIVFGRPAANLLIPLAFIFIVSQVLRIARVVSRLSR